LFSLFLEGKLPTVAEYNKYAVEINKTAADTFRYLNFDKLPDFVATSKDVDLGKKKSDDGDRGDDAGGGVDGDINDLYDVDSF